MKRLNSNVIDRSPKPARNRLCEYSTAQWVDWNVMTTEPSSRGAQRRGDPVNGSNIEFIGLDCHAPAVLAKTLFSGLETLAIRRPQSGHEDPVV